MSRRKALTGEVHRFSKTTTIRGITRITNTENSLTLRILWSIAVVCAATITIYQLSAVVAKYLQYNENVNLFYLDSNPDFPDVSACKVNLYSRTWLDPRQATFDEYYTFMKLLQTDRMTIGDSRIESINASSFSNNWNKIVDFLLSPDGYFANNILSEVDLSTNTSTLFRHLEYYSWNLMSLSNDPDLSFSSVTNLDYNPEFQLCYRLHLPVKRARDVRAMTAILYTKDFPTDSIQVLDSSLRRSATSGVHIVLHERDSYPITESSVNIAAGQETTISIRAKAIQRLGKPYDKCESVKYLTKSGDYEPGALRYSVDACNDLCIQHYIMDECQCIDGTRTFTKIELNSGKPLCGNMNFTHGFPPTPETMTRGMKQLDCAFRVISAIESHIITPECRCPVPCFEYSYQMSTFSNPWPHRSFQLAFYRDFIRGKETFGNRFDIYSKIEKNDSLTALEKLEKLNSLHLIEQNFARLKIVFERRGVETHNSSAALTWEGLASNVGGSLSLWIGITVMTFFEFVELVIRLVQMIIAGHRDSNQLSENVSDFDSKDADSVATSGSVVTAVINEEKPALKNLYDQITTF